MASDERDGRVPLTVLTVLALTAGAAWWRAAAPEPGAATAVPVPPASAEPVARTWRVDPSTGDAWPARPGRDPTPLALRGPATAPDRSVVIRVEDDGTSRVLQVSHVVWRETSDLTPDGPPVVRQVNPSRGDDYRLSVSCSGDGAVAVQLSGAGTGDAQRVLRCGGRLELPLLGGTGAPVLVRFSGVRGRAELDARLEALY
ncbi:MULTISPECIES: hypothetical protein [unclassified Micromonospora]|uniref:hypothetical protein n=1 Tax=unclassified Micromonospora TaxID=2617518 RepID=UPI00188E7B03|nr:MULTISPECIES: hypothetical protein [unclassified Micromonospora]MBF5032178.1 hypothetical protein [Micromonospora sp. ANENR4]WBC02720.1 hypothetical protein O7546_26980 [Micromonospora sp. WMMA1976]